MKSLRTQLAEVTYSNNVTPLEHSEALNLVTEAEMRAYELAALESRLYGEYVDGFASELKFSDPLRAHATVTLFLLDDYRHLLRVRETARQAAEAATEAIDKLRRVK